MNLSSYSISNYRLQHGQPSWVTEEEFGMGYLELKPAPSMASKSATGNSSGGVSQGEPTGGRVTSEGQALDSGISQKDQTFRTKPIDGRVESSSSNARLKGGLVANGPDMLASGVQGAISRSSEKHVDEPPNKSMDENVAKVTMKASTESEVLSIMFLVIRIFDLNIKGAQ